MSVYVGLRGMVIEVDRPGTLISGRDMPRTDRFQELSFVGINRAIIGVLTTFEINILAMHGDVCWDLLLNLEARLRRARGGGVFCDLCLPEARRVFADRPALCADHRFEPFLEWVNDNLAKAKWLR